MRSPTTRFSRRTLFAGDSTPVFPTWFPLFKKPGYSKRQTILNLKWTNKPENSLPAPTLCRSLKGQALRCWSIRFTSLVICRSVDETAREIKKIWGYFVSLPLDCTALFSMDSFSFSFYLYFRKLGNVQGNS